MKRNTSMVVDVLPNTLAGGLADGVCRGPRGCPGPRGPQGATGPQPPLSDAVDSAASDVAASSLAVRTVYERTRAPATGNLTLYVRAEGADSNDGLSAASAKASIQGALQAVDGYDLRRSALTVNLGDGTFAVPSALIGPQLLSSAGTITFAGQGKDRTTVLGRWGLHAVPRIYLRSMTLEGSESGILNVSDHTTLLLYAVRLRGRGDVGIYAARGACVQFADSASELEGAFSSVLAACYAAHISALQKTITVSDPLQCGQFLHAYRYGTIDMRGEFLNPHLVGSGAKWSLGMGGQLIYGGNDPTTTIPGAAHGRATGANLLTGDASLARVWLSAQANGALICSHNILACEKTATGTYRYTCNIAVDGKTMSLVCPSADAAGAYGWVTSASGQTFTVVTRLNGVIADSPHCAALFW